MNVATFLHQYLDRPFLGLKIPSLLAVFLKCIFLYHAIDVVTKVHQYLHHATNKNNQS